MKNIYNPVEIAGGSGAMVNIPCTTNKFMYAVEIDGKRFRGYRGKQAWTTYGAAVNAFEQSLFNNIWFAGNNAFKADKEIYKMVNNTINNLINDGRLVIRKLK